MIRITILTVGKSSPSWIDEGIRQYETRLKSHIAIEWRTLKDDDALIAIVEKTHAPVLLDENGTEYTSIRFADVLFKMIESGGSRLTLVIGGAEGLPAALKGRYPAISLSKMTLPHQVIKMMLVEQIYRAWTLREGIPYHKA